jgi:hypothetical protein
MCVCKHWLTSILTTPCSRHSCSALSHANALSTGAIEVAMLQGQVTTTLGIVHTKDLSSEASKVEASATDVRTNMDNMRVAENKHCTTCLMVQTFCMR